MLSRKGLKGYTQARDWCFLRLMLQSILWHYRWAFEDNNFVWAESSKKKNLFSLFLNFLPNLKSMPKKKTFFFYDNDDNSWRMRRTFFFLAPIEKLSNEDNRSTGMKQARSKSCNSDLHTRFAHENFFFPSPSYSNKSGKVDHWEIDEASNEARNCTIKRKYSSLAKWIYLFSALCSRKIVFEMKNSRVSPTPNNNHTNLSFIIWLGYIPSYSYEELREKWEWEKRLREKSISPHSTVTFSNEILFKTFSIARNVCLFFYFSSNFNLHLLASFQISIQKS